MKWLFAAVASSCKAQAVVVPSGASDPSKSDWFDETTYNIANNKITYSKDVFIRNLPSGVRQAEIHIGPLKHKDNGEYWTMSEIKEGGSSEKAYIVAGLLPIKNPASLNRPDVELGAVILPESEIKEILENSKKEELINLINLSREVHEQMGVTDSLCKTRKFYKISILYDDYFM